MHRSAGLQVHVGEGIFGGFAVNRILEGGGVGNAAGDLRDHAGIGSPGDHGRDVRGLQSDDGIVFRARVGDQGFQYWTAS